MISPTTAPAIQMMIVISKSPRGGQFTARVFQVPHHDADNSSACDDRGVPVSSKGNKGRNKHCSDLWSCYQPVIRAVAPLITSSG
jgi:hypothetical protein